MENEIIGSAESTKTKVGFFEVSEGNKSSMRLQSFISLWMSFVFAIITILNKASDSTTGLILTISFLTGAFAPKAIQSFSENMDFLSVLKKK